MFASRGSRDFVRGSIPFGVIIDDVGLGAGVKALPLIVELLALSASFRLDVSATYCRHAASRDNMRSSGIG